MNGGRAPDGLVICATTSRVPTTEVDISAPDDLSGLLSAYVGSFPSSQDVDTAARALAELPAWDGPERPAAGPWRVARLLPMHGPAPEGPRARLVCAPGSLALARRDPARGERAHERAVAAAVKAQDEGARTFLRTGEWPAERPSRRVCERWSRRSRSRMTRALAELDYRPLLGVVGLVPAMVTLTYPGDWLTVAPNGAAVKRHLDLLRKRFRRAWGTDLIGVWKLEFQGRGAPHFHILTVPPRGRAHPRVCGGGLPFRQWLSLNWAQIVGHPDPVEYLNHLGAGTGIDFAEGLRHRDPKRISVYFTKHGVFSAKEYQNVVPAPWREPGCGPGRFWGYWGLSRLTRSAEVGPETAVWAARLMRRYARAQGTTRQATVRRTRGGRMLATAPDIVGLAGAQLYEESRHTSTRRVRRRGKRMSTGAGWLSVNDGPAFALALSRALTIIDPWRQP